MPQQAQKTKSSLLTTILKYLFGLIVVIIILYFIFVAIINALIDRSVKRFNEESMRNSSPPIRL